MNIEDSIAFVSGTSRGIGRAYVEGLLARGAEKIYAGARDTSAIADLVASGGGRVVALALDVTDPAAVRAAAAQALDTNLPINNAGYNNNSPLLGVGDLAPARLEMRRITSAPWPCVGPSQLSLMPMAAAPSSTCCRSCRG